MKVLSWIFVRFMIWNSKAQKQKQSKMKKFIQEKVINNQIYHLKYLNIKFKLINYSKYIFLFKGYKMNSSCADILLFAAFKW